MVIPVKTPVQGRSPDPTSAGLKNLMNLSSSTAEAPHDLISPVTNDHTIGWQNSNPLSHSNTTLVPQARQARASGENLNYSLSHYSDILSMIIGVTENVYVRCV